MNNLLVSIFLILISASIYAESTSFYQNKENSLLSSKLKSDIEITDILESGGNPDKADSSGIFFPLYSAAGENRINTVKILLKYNANIDFKTDIGGTALNVASFNGHAEMVELLLKSGANPCIKNALKKDSFELAKHQGKTKVLQILNNSPSGKKCLKDKQVRTEYIFSGTWGNEPIKAYITWVDYDKDVEGFFEFTNTSKKKGFIGKNDKFGSLKLSFEGENEIHFLAEYVKNDKIWKNQNQNQNQNQKIVFSRPVK